MTPVPDGTLVSDELNIYPDHMTIAAYGRKLRYTSFFASDVGDLMDTGSGQELGDCTATMGAKSVNCDLQHVLTPRLTCEWVN